MLEQLIETIITQLPNFLGLVLALVIIANQNAKLTQALIEATKPQNVRDLVHQTLKEQGIAIVAQPEKAAPADAAKV